MALDFPNAPTTGQNFTGPNGVVWQWDGVKWVSGAGTTVYAPLSSPVFVGDPRAPNPAAGDADTSVATTSFVAASVGTALHDIGRNLIHNPLFNVAQRGAGPFTTNSVYTLDRWFISFNLDTNSITQQAVAPGGVAGDEACAFVLANSGFVGNAGAAAYTVLTQFVEGTQRLSGKTITISFFAYSNAGQKLGVSYDQIFGTGGSPSANIYAAGQSVTISAGVWARYSLTFAIPSITGKTLGTNKDDKTGINFWFSSGSGQATRAGNVGVQSGNVSLWGVQLEIGGQATPLEKPDPRYDLSNCQRFFLAASIYVGPSGLYATTFSFPSTMRAIPTVAGGGAGYAAVGLDAHAITHVQTANSSQNMTFSAEL
jgi:hypothetical protein